MDFTNIALFVLGFVLGFISVKYAKKYLAEAK